MDFIDVLIDKHIKTWNPADVRDFTDAFLKEMKKVGWCQQTLRFWGNSSAYLSSLIEADFPHKAV